MSRGFLTLLHSERPKLYGVFAFAIRAASSGCSEWGMEGGGGGSDGAMVLGKLPSPGRPTFLD